MACVGVDAGWCGGRGVVIVAYVFICVGGGVDVICVA